MQEQTFYQVWKGTTSEIKSAIYKSILLRVEGILTRQQVLSEAQGKEQGALFRCL